MDFSDDVVRIVQTAINLEGGQPESRKANSMVKSFFIRVRPEQELAQCLQWIVLQAWSTAVYNTNTAMFLTANGTGFSLVQGEGIKILGGTESLLQVRVFFLLISTYVFSIEA